MTNQHLPQRSNASYTHLSSTLTNVIGEDLLAWNNRLHLSSQKYSVSLTTLNKEVVTSDLLCPHFYTTLNAEKSPVWVVNGFSFIQGQADLMQLTGWFDLIIRDREAVKNTASYFTLYDQCNKALNNHRTLSGWVFLDWVIQPVDIEYENGVGEGYRLRCCVEPCESVEYKFMVERLHQLTEVMAGCLAEG